ncbi:MAG: beta-galactosidase [Clostridia bacterium]|nr:beta-galactosidase [Clostridia bacterium]
MNIPRSEYPRPDFVRPDWLSLNGEWQFEIDNSSSGEERKLFDAKNLSGKIILPFAPESDLSGVGNKDFMSCVWYKREVEIPDNWSDKKIIFHIGASDYHTKVWANGIYLGEHFGGYTPFKFDITDYITEDKVILTVCAYDNTRDPNQPCGKQSHQFDSFGCHYTRTTGIWQTVWLEAVNPCYIESAKYYTDISAPSVTITAKLPSAALGAELVALAKYEGVECGRASVTVCGMTATVTLSLSEKHIWEIGNGRLYDLTLTLEKDGKTLDRVESYFGLRSVAIDGYKFLLNGKSTFQRLVLDQGFYPDGVYTAPTDEALINDIKLSIELGFNGARLHQKVFEPRFLYHADKMGYLVWGEYANWGIDIDNGYGRFVLEFIESMERDFNHPSIIGWCPLNENWDNSQNGHDRKNIKAIYDIVTAFDPTRIVVDCSGGNHGVRTIYDVHDYEQDVAKFRYRHKHALEDDFSSTRAYLMNDPLETEAYFVSEYGGIAWNKKEGGWGYGNAPEALEEFYERYKGLTDALLDSEHIFGFCYTQLYDVEQEQNGLLTYQREGKFDAEKIREINLRKAAIED